MAKILPFRPLKASERHRGNTLCRNGHHKWQLDKKTVFDVKLGKLVSRYSCTRCGRIKTQAD